MNRSLPSKAAIEEAFAQLLRRGFELAYLALLTVEGIKPASRWEKPLEAEAAHALSEKLGLHLKVVPRTVQTGREIHEAVFSLYPPYPELYAARFAHTPIENTADIMRLEGFLFGYPPCCVERFIRHPYAPNNLDPADQSLLFHWACSACPITPHLLPFYRDCHRRVRDLAKEKGIPLDPQNEFIGLSSQKITSGNGERLRGRLFERSD